MIADETKVAIQDAYRAWLGGTGFRPRRMQREMIATITRTLSRSLGLGNDEAGAPIAVIEAGTGTGKTVAYALAVLPLAMAEGRRLVVATATTTLQEQLVNKDLPDLAAHSGLSFTYTLAKGRGRYVCPWKLTRLLRGESVNEALFEDEAQRAADDYRDLYQTMDQRLDSGDWDGDRDHWPDSLMDRAWQPVTTDRRQCLGYRCREFRRCSFYQAREAMENADCIVTNHDLVLSDLALGGGVVLPEPSETLYVFDEGHHLAEKTQNHFSAHGRIGTILCWLDELEGDLPRLAAAFQQRGDMAAWVDEAVQALPPWRQTLHALREWVIDWLAEPEQRGLEQPRLPAPLPPALAANVHELRRQTAVFLKPMNALADRLQACLSDEQALVALEAETWHPRVGRHVSRAEAMLGLWEAYERTMDPGDTPPVRWVQAVTTDAGVDWVLSYSPLLAAHTLRNLLWDRCLGAVVTSATLTALGEFTVLREQTGLPEDSVFQRLPSPFDYPRRAQLVVPALTADPGDPAAHTAEVLARLPGLIREDEATLVLFASRYQMQAVLAGLPDELRQRVWCQDDWPKTELLARHRTAVDRGEGSVIVGLASLAEGVDLPGRYCRHVIIAKLPFAPPDSPRDAALADWVKARGGNPFMEVTLPAAGLRLAQACGRLIRHETDEGRVTLLDRRVVTRRYGARLLDSLPPFQRVIEATAEA